MQRLDTGSGFAAPARLVVLWAYAVFEARARAEEVQRQWRVAVDRQLEAAGVFARMKTANLAIAAPAFAAALNAAAEERAAAKDENDIAAIVRRILAEMGVDQADLMIRLRRAFDYEIPRWMRREGGAQLRISAKPTIAAAQRAIDAAAAAGYPIPGSEGAGAAEAVAEDAADAGDPAQAGHGNIGV
jgi:hypothetical protein